MDTQAKRQMPERWKPIKGYEGRYQISNHGNVKSLSRSYVTGFGCVRNISSMIMRKQEHTRGYHIIFLYSEGKMMKHFVHRLVALHFIPNPENKEIVNHKDRDKTHNHIRNLEWCTGSENTRHYYDTEKQKVVYEDVVIDPVDLPF